MTRLKAMKEDEDKARLRSIWHSIKKFFLRYVVLVSISFKKLFKISSDRHTRYVYFLFTSLQMILLIAVLFLLVEALHMLHHNDEKFYYLRKIIGVGSGWNKIAFFRLLILYRFYPSFSWVLNETQFTTIYSSIHKAIVCTYTHSAFM